MFVALLMAANGSPDLDDKETRDKIIAEAIDFNKLEWRGKKALGLHYAQNQPKPYTGWSKLMHENGRIRMLFQFKDGETDGLLIGWYPNGREEAEWTYKDGKLMTAVGWKPNGEKRPETNIVNGNGVWVYYHDGGTEGVRHTYKDGEIVGTIDYYYLKGQKRSECAWKNGKLVTAVSWKPNGDKCPVTNLKDEDLAMNLRTRISRADGYRQLEMFAD